MGFLLRSSERLERSSLTLNLGITTGGRLITGGGGGSEGSGVGSRATIGDRERVRRAADLRCCLPLEEPLEDAEEPPLVDDELDAELLLSLELLLELLELRRREPA